MEAITSLNPVNFFPMEVTLKIFKFFKGKDLLKASLVSKDWYDFIADTPECMRKIEVNLKCCSNKGTSSEAIKRLAKSRRKYENLKISRCCHCIDAVDPLIGATSKLWKKVTFSIVSFNSSYQACYYLACIEKSVEKLVLSGIYLKEVSLSPAYRNFTFLKLTNLIATEISPFLFHALENVKNLQTLTLSSRSLSSEPFTVIENLLMSNVKLKVLKISDSVFNQIMTHNIAPDLKFKLKKLAVNNRHRDLAYYDTIQDNFSAFLKSQKSLENVHLNDWSGVEVLKQVYRLPIVKSLTLTGLEFAEYPVNWENLELPINNSVVELILYSSSNNLQMLKVITAAVPKLTVFKIPSIDQSLLNHVSATHKELEILAALTLEMNDIVIDKNFFKSLKHLLFKSCNADLVKRTMEKAEADLVHFEVLLKTRFARNLTINQGLVQENL